MEVGEPDFETPACIIEAARESLQKGETHYTHSLGRPDLRQAIAAWHLRQYGVDTDPDTILVASGSSQALLLAFLALCDPGDEVILSNPGYACYPQIVTVSGGKPVFVDVHEEDGFQYHPEAIQKKLSTRTKAILVNSPANPTGNTIAAGRLAEICSLGPPVISDEIYHGLVYQGRAVSAREITDRCLVVNGFSKLFAMTGWRLGYLIVPPELVRPLQKMQQNFFISAGDFVQAAAIAALTRCDETVERMRRAYEIRRQFVLRRCREIGLGVTIEPEGAFYVFVNVKHLCAARAAHSYDLAFDILDKAQVAVTPGTDFGTGGEGYLRLSYADSLERLEEGMQRLEAYVKAYG
jgi:aspartate/methionine/tyrosine aminotransferase